MSDTIRGQLLYKGGMRPSDFTFARMVNGQERVIDHIMVDGERYERARERCWYCRDGETFNRQTWMVCNHGTQRINYCPNFGARMEVADNGVLCR